MVAQTGWVLVNLVTVKFTFETYLSINIESVAHKTSEKKKERPYAFLPGDNTTAKEKE